MFSAGITPGFATVPSGAGETRTFCPGSIGVGKASLSECGLYEETTGPIASLPPCREGRTGRRPPPRLGQTANVGRVLPTARAVRHAASASGLPQQKVLQN